MHKLPRRQHLSQVYSWLVTGGLAEVSDPRAAPSRKFLETPCSGNNGRCMCNRLHVAHVPVQISDFFCFVVPWGGGLVLFAARMHAPGPCLSMHL